jgi:hypothetical protein
LKKNEIYSSVMTGWNYSEYLSVTGKDRQEEVEQKVKKV